MTRTRLVLLVALAVLAAGLAVALAHAGSRPDPVPRARAVSATPADPPAAALLRAWDEQRAAAFAAGSARMLRDLYVPGSEAGRADLRVLRAYDDRGLRVEGMRTQVLALRVVARTERRCVIDVTDRVADAVAVGETGRVALPRDAADSRRVVLVRGPDGAWRVASVRPVATVR